jgi:hypothetical protein
MTTLAGPEVLPDSASGTSTITVRPLQPTIGAEIEGVDLAQPLSTAARDEIKAAILRYKVVFFRDQDVDRDQHAAFAQQFGPLYVHPSVNKPDAGQLPAAHRIAAEDTKKYADLLAQQQAEGWDPSAGHPRGSGRYRREAPGRVRGRAAGASGLRSSRLQLAIKPSDNI